MDKTSGVESRSEIAEREREFFNEKAGRYQFLRDLIWRAIGAFNRNEELHDLYDPAGKRVLLYGCGPNNALDELFDAGAVHVSGIDISDLDIAAANAQARDLGYADRAEFVVADAQSTGFPDDAFDLIIGSAILHHLDVRMALTELRRILAPGGRAVFLEPLAHNPILRLGRRLTPSARTPDEHPFTVDDWRLCKNEFPNFSHREVEFTSIPLMPLNLLLPRTLQERLAARIKRFDERLLARYPSLGRHARTTFIVLE